MDVQAHLPPALAALHNFFIHIHDPDEIDDMLCPDGVDVEATSSLGKLRRSGLTTGGMR